MYTSYEIYFGGRDTRHTLIVDRDPWPVIYLSSLAIMVIYIIIVILIILIIVITMTITIIFIGIVS